MRAFILCAILFLLLACGCSMVQSAWSPDSNHIVFPFYKIAPTQKEAETPGLAVYDLTTKTTRILIPQTIDKTAQWYLPWFKEDGKEIFIAEFSSNAGKKKQPNAKGKLIEAETGALIKPFNLSIPMMKSGVFYHNTFLYEYDLFSRDALENDGFDNPDTWPPLGIRMLNLTDNTEQVLFEKQTIHCILKMGNEIGFIGQPAYNTELLKNASEEQGEAMMHDQYSTLLFGKIDPDKKAQTVFATIKAQDLGGKSFIPYSIPSDTNEHTIASIVMISQTNLDDIECESGADCEDQDDEKQILLIIADDGTILHKDKIPATMGLPTAIQLSENGSLVYFIDIDDKKRELEIVEYNYLTKHLRRISILHDILLPGEDSLESTCDMVTAMASCNIHFDLKLSPDGKTLAFTILPWKKATDLGNNKLGYDFKNEVYHDNAPLYLIDLTSPERTVTEVRIPDTPLSNSKP